MSDFRIPTAKSIVLAAIPTGEAVTIAKITAWMLANSSSNYAAISLRAALKELCDTGEVIKVARGLYSLPGFEGKIGSIDTPRPVTNAVNAPSIRNFILTTLAGHRSRAKYVVRDAHTLKREYREIHGVTLEWRIFDNELKALMAEGTLYQVEQDWLKDTYMGEKDVIERALLKGPPAAVDDIFA